MINKILNDADRRMGRSVDATREEFATIRAGRVDPSMFSKLTADYYGTATPVQQLASFTSQDARTIIVAPYDVGALEAIEKAIRDSDLGVNPANDGKSIRCVFPELTEERRKDYIRIVRAQAEDGRVSVRNIRRGAKQELERMQKDGDVSEDELKGGEKRLDSITRKHTDHIDELLKSKEAELLEV